MAIIKKYGPFLNLRNFQTFITDTSATSEYFRITELNNSLTGGKNGFLIEGSEYLKETTEVKIEVLDVEGNPVYVEPGDGNPEYYEGVSKLIAIYVYPDTPIGLGSITILGELKKYIDTDESIVDVPTEWRNIYNLKWSRSIKIDKSLPNEDRVRFYLRPKATIDEIVKPIFTKSIPNIVQSGTLRGIPEYPAAGTTYADWRADTLYRLTITDGSNWTSSVDENVVSMPDINYSPTVIEVLNSKSVLVDVPYVNNGIISTFDSTPYTTTFESVESQTVDNSILVGSFADIKFTDLKTFVGDVARVKVYRKSRNEIGDYQFIQDVKLESTELLRDLTSTIDTEILYGNFTDYNLETYWVTSSIESPVSIDTEILQGSVKVDYDTVGDTVQLLTTSGSYSITKDIEYTLSFKTILSGSVDSGKTLRAYLSSSTYAQDIVNITAADTYLQRVNVTENIISDQDDDMYLVFEFVGDDWYISNISLRNAQETSFSPDEFSLVQEVPRKLPTETFDFRFEFYDINNNYIPTDILKSHTFTGGNASDTDNLVKFFTFEAFNNVFRFTSGSLGNPVFQQIGFTTTKNLFTGSVTYASAAYDNAGEYIDPLSYNGVYPGRLTNTSDSGATLVMSNFSGSDTSVIVGSITYTASIEDVEAYETIYRYDEGDNASALVVTSNANQFIYEPTIMAPKPLGQQILISVSRKNLASDTTTITANSSSNVPLTEVSDISGIKTYSINAITSSADLEYGFPYESGSVTYAFTGSDIFGINYSDIITISPVMNFDGVSVVLSTESTSFSSLSTGYVTDAEYDNGDGTVTMLIGSNTIQHQDNVTSNTPNRFDITSITGIGCIPNDTAASGSEYGIRSMSSDSASLDMNIRYLAGDGSTTVDFVKKVNYTKSKSAAPNVLITATPLAQSVTANVDFTVVGTPTDITIDCSEGSIDYSYTTGIPSNRQYKITSIISGSDNLDGTITPDTPTNVSGSNGIVTLSYKNSEGTLVENKTINFNISATLKGDTGSSGEAFRSVKLTSSNYVITYDENGNNPIPAGPLTLTATSQNFTNTWFRFTGDIPTPSGSFTDGVGINYSTALYDVPLTYGEMSGDDVITVEVSEGDQTPLASDSISILGVKPGTPGPATIFYFIKPLSGSQIKNKQGSLELQVMYASASVITEVSSGDNKLYDGTTLLTDVGGITDGGNGINYNPIFYASDITGSKVISLKDVSLNTLDTITLMDVTDGLGGGTISSTVLKTTRINIGTPTTPIYSYTPAEIAVTGSFWGTNGTEYTSSLVISASYNDISYLDEMRFVTDIVNPGRIELFVDDGDGNVMVDNVPTPTKDTNVTYRFVDPQTGDITSVQETFYVISDGQDGESAITTLVTNDSHTIPADKRGGVIVPDGFVGSGTRIVVYEGATQLEYDGIGTSNGTWSASYEETFVTSGGITDGGAYANVAPLTAMDSGSDTGAIDFTIIGKRLDGTPISIIKTQTFSKSKKGDDSQGVTLTASQYTVKYDGDGNEVNPATITLTASTSTFLEPYFQFLKDDVEYQTYSTTITCPILEVDEPGVDEVNTWKVNVKEGGGSADLTGDIIAFDSVDIVGIKEGADAFTVFLTNDSHTFSAGVSGSYGDIDYDGSEFEIRVYRGTTLYTYDGGVTPAPDTYSIVSATHVGITTSGSIDLDQQKYTPTAISSDQGSVTVVIEDNATSTQFTKKFTFGVSRVGETGAAGLDGKTVKLTSPYYVIGYDSTGETPSPSLAFDLTAESTNFVDAYFKFTGHTGIMTSETSFTNGIGQNSDTFEITPPTTYVSTPYWIKVEVSEASDPTTVLAYDTITISTVKPGADGIDVISGYITNDSHTVTTKSDGTDYSLVGSGGTFLMYDGVTNKTGTLGPSTYSITGGTDSGTTWSKTQNGLTMTIGTSTGVYTLSGTGNTWTSDTETFELIGTYNGTPITKSYTISKSKKGEDSKVVKLTSDSLFVTYNTLGIEDPAAQIVTLTATQSNHDLTQGDGNVYYEFFQGTTSAINSINNEFILGTTGGSSKPNVNESVNITVKTREGASTGTVIATDTVSIYGTKSGRDSINVTLTNEAHTFVADEDGSVAVGDYVGSGTTIIVRRGATLLTGILSGTPNENQYTVSTTVDPVGVVGVDTSPTVPIKNMVYGDVTSMTTEKASVEYTITVSSGTSQEIFTKTQTYTIAKTGVTGRTGPGVVFRGVWDSTVTYQYNLTTTRRDAVLWEGTTPGTYDTYYLALENASTNYGQNPKTATTYWVEGGTESFFVAAEVAIFKESFIKQTLNVGTNAAGNAANIVIAGGTTSPYIALGQTTPAYNSNGIWLGVDSSTYKFSLKSATNSLTWDGSTLGVTGTVTASAGTIGGWTIGAQTISSSSTGIIMTGTTATITITGTSGKIVSGKTSFGTAAAGFFLGRDSSVPKFRIGNADNTTGLTWDGTDLTVNGSGTFTGTITATAGYIGGTSGWTIAEAVIYNGKETFTGTDAGIYIGVDGISSGLAGVPTFSVDNKGDLTAKKGSIGGWTIDNDSIYSGTKEAVNGGYTSAAGDVTIRSDGSFHSPMLYINTNGSAGFRGNLVSTVSESKSYTTATLFQVLEAKPTIFVESGTTPSSPSARIEGDIYVFKNTSTNQRSISVCIDNATTGTKRWYLIKTWIATDGTALPDNGGGTT